MCRRQPIPNPPVTPQSVAPQSQPWLRRRDNLSAAKRLHHPTSGAAPGPADRGGSGHSGQHHKDYPRRTPARPPKRSRTPPPPPPSDPRHALTAPNRPTPTYQRCPGLDKARTCHTAYHIATQLPVASGTELGAEGGRQNCRAGRALVKTVSCQKRWHPSFKYTAAPTSHRLSCSRALGLGTSAVGHRLPQLRAADATALSDW